MKEVNRLLKEIHKSKVTYKDKVEQLFQTNSSSEAWKGLRQMAGMDSASTMLTPECDSKTFADELNAFYGRFDIHDESSDIIDIQRTLRSQLQNAPQPSLTVEDVRNCFSQQKCKKAAGPDHIQARVIKTCASQLVPVFTNIFNRSLKLGIVPDCWKRSTLVPVPKSNMPAVKNNLRPVALTDILMKNFERLFLCHLHPEIDPFQDNLQFAYSPGLGVEDAVLTVLHNIYQHVNTAGHYVRALFIYFSSAFNTISPALLGKKLMAMHVNPHLTLWITSFLTERTQRVRFRDTMSNSITVNTGAPQGCVLSPVLFILYTSGCKSASVNCPIIKYADDTVIIGCLKRNGNEDSYNETVHSFVEWCDAHNLCLNVKKTKEMVIDYSTTGTIYQNMSIKDELVEQVNTYKYLGTLLDNKLEWKHNTQLLCSKSNKRMYYLRCLKKCKVDQTILRLFFNSVILSVLTFCQVCWWGNLTEELKQKVGRIVRTASQIMGADNITDIPKLFEKKQQMMCSRILSNKVHPLHEYFC